MYNGSLSNDNFASKSVRMTRPNAMNVVLQFSGPRAFDHEFYCYRRPRRCVNNCNFGLVTDRDCFMKMFIVLTTISWVYF